MADYDYRYLEPEAFYAFFDAENAKVFEGDTFIYPNRVIYDEEARARLERLKPDWKNRVKLLLGVYQGEELVAWSESAQAGGEELVMHTSAVKPAHRGRGVYARMLRLVIERARELGFQRITSFHYADNNAIIIPKLKAGFVITGLEYKDDIGVLVKLSYLIHPERRALVEVRTGHSRPDARLRSLLGY